MCGYQELNGADSEQEYVDPRDFACSYCARTFSPPDQLTPVTLGGSTSYLCESCRERQSEHYQEMTALDGMDIAAKEAARETAA